MIPPKVRRLQVLNHGSEVDARSAAARALAAAVRKATGPLTLLLSGGSALGILESLRAEPDLLPADLRHLELGLVDERWGPGENGAGHGASNARALLDHGFLAWAGARGANFRGVLPKAGEEAMGARACASAYEKWLVGRFARSTVLATVGVGADGHTFGVLPQEGVEVFSNLFPSDRLFVAYEHPGPAEHRARLTMTPAAASELEAVFGVALGAAKAPVLEELRHPRPKRPVHLFPAAMLRSLEGALYSDRLSP